MSATPPVRIRPTDDPPSACPLVGRWRIARSVRDHRRGENATFAGWATIGADPAASGQLLWHEEGELVSGAHRGAAHRTMRIVPAGDAWEVRFADGRPFHSLDLAGGACTVVHLCSPDRYDGAFILRTADDLTVRWRVHGPAKDLEIVSDYRRAPDG